MPHFALPRPLAVKDKPAFGKQEGSELSRSKHFVLWLPTQMYKAMQKLEWDISMGKTPDNNRGF